MADYSRLDVLILAQKAVKMPSKCGHSDIGETLVLMLKDTLSSNAAHERIAGLMKSYGG